MNDKLQSELGLWLSELRASAAQGREFVIEQAPEFVREIVAFGRAESTTGLIAGPILIAIGIVMVRRWWRWAETFKGADDRAVGGVLGTIVAALPIILGAAAISVNCHPFFTSWFAPRVYAITQIAEMIGKAAGK